MTDGRRLWPCVSQPVVAAVLAAALAGCIGGPRGDERDSNERDSRPPGDTDHGWFDTGIEHVPGGGDPVGDLFLDGALPHFTIYMDEDQADILRAEDSMSERNWVEASLYFGERHYGPIGVRMKGQNSFLPFMHKPSLKLKFGHIIPGGTFLGFRGLTLNNMSEDPSMVHERLAYRLYRHAGVPAYRANHATVTIVETAQGRPVSTRELGLYTLLENANKDMVARWLDNSGSLWELNDVDFYDDYLNPCDNEAGYDCFQLKFGDDDRSSLQAAAAAMQNTGEDALEAARDSVDYHQFLKYWAVSAVVSQFDGYPYSVPGDDMLVYADPTSGLLKFFPHGCDETLDFCRSNPLDPIRIKGILAKRCLEVPDCMETLHGLIWEVQDVSEEIGFLAYFDQVVEEIEALVITDTNKPYSDEAVWEEQTWVRNCIASRRGQMGAFIDETTSSDPSD